MHIEDWFLYENLSYHEELHFAGGGHVDLALSKMGYLLNFKFFTYDNRIGLNTVDNNAIAKHICVPDYKDIDQVITNGENKFVVLMSFGYMTDKIVLKNLINNSFAYLGMMGSKEKVRRLIEELKAEKISLSKLNEVHSPIGLNIKSKTPEEIAVSILAEIISVKNNY